MLLFRSIDRNHDGRLNKDELREAFQKAGLTVPVRRLNGFFDEIDMNHDGYITFDEWRDFLLFIPTKSGDSPLEAALSYYSTDVVLNAEGDSMVSDETLEGLGTTGNLLQALFGSILKLAQPIVTTTRSSEGEGSEQSQFLTPEPQEKDEHRHRKRRRLHPPQRNVVSEQNLSGSASIEPLSSPPPPLLSDTDVLVEEKEWAQEIKGTSAPSETKAKASLSSAAASTSTNASAGGGGKNEKREKASAATVTSDTPATSTTAHCVADTADTLSTGRGIRQGDSQELVNIDEVEEAVDGQAAVTAAAANGTKLQKALIGNQKKSRNSRLTQYVPHPGYFLAGALAGGISRTATAPFDRLKVYLLVSTQSKGVGASAVGEATKAAAGSSLAAESLPKHLRKTGRPIRDAMVNLYRAGGLRTFFTGRLRASFWPSFFVLLNSNDSGNGLNVVKIMPETAIKVCYLQLPVIFIFRRCVNNAPSLAHMKRRNARLQLSRVTPIQRTYGRLPSSWPVVWPA